MEIAVRQSRFGFKTLITETDTAKIEMDFYYKEDQFRITEELICAAFDMCPDDDMTDAIGELMDKFDA